MVFGVGGPNIRTDFHINEGEEFFYQVEGDINLRMLIGGKPKEFPIRQGEIYLLPPKVPHSPQRPAGTVGVVLERKRLAHEIDTLLWICESCHHPLYREDFHLKNIVEDLVPVIQRYQSNEQHRKCLKCGKVASLA